LARYEVRRRHTRSLIGIAWLPLNLLLMVGVLTFVFVVPLGGDWHAYPAYLAIGLTMWQFVQATLSEAPHAFVSAADTIRAAPLPLSIFPLRLVWRNVLTLAWQAPIVVLALLLLGVRPLLWPLPLGLLLFLVAAASSALLLAIVGARFRDVQPIVSNALQMLFFLTPILWLPGAMGAGRFWLVAANPIFAFVDIVRAPLLGGHAAATSWQVAGGCTVVLCGLAFAALAAFRTRIPYWI
jgi:ABC-type polysaccharide/polyol phosphate export permease